MDAGTRNTLFVVIAIVIGGARAVPMFGQEPLSAVAGFALGGMIGIFILLFVLHAIYEKVKAKVIHTTNN